MSVVSETVDQTFFNVAQVAERLNVKPRMVRRLISDGRLPAFRFGMHVRVGEADLLEFIANARSADA